ncbi:hypothetical protein [Mesorhizobium sp. LjNodule214]|uniref:hypothetical protein n=1 Tax=Mesorhizobium sp. LjNodule214 TaxID=3342252 RepID=UPI003ECC9C7E
MIEEARQIGKNPVLTADLQEPYQQAWRHLVQIGLRELDAAEESLLVSCIIAVIAMGKSQFNLGRFAVLFDEDERKEFFNQAVWP